MAKEDFVITDGVVEYKHSKPVGDYDNKTASVRLSFSIAEGSNAEIVTHLVMLKAEREVESTLSGECRGKPVEEIVPLKPQRGRPKKVGIEDTASIVEPEELTSEEATEILDELEEQPSLTLKGDIQPLAQKVSAHLRKVSGNINKLREVIKDSGGTSLLTIPQENWPIFIKKAKELLS